MTPPVPNPVPPVAGYGRGHRALEVGSIILFLGGIGLMAVQTARALQRPGQLIPLALAALGGYLVADFLSGLTHWAGDTLGDVNTPLFGPNFVRPFREHHTDPKAITHHDFVETNGNSCIVIMPVLLAALLIMPSETGALFYACLTFGFTTFFVFCTNQFHKWAHDDNAPTAVKVLQRMGLILSPQHHAIHHAPPHDKYYCITVGWMNPVLQRLRFFRFCEAIVARVRPSFLHLEERTRAR